MAEQYRSQKQKWNELNEKHSDLLQKYNDLREENEKLKKELEFHQSGKVRVTMVNYKCSCGYKNVGFPNDGKCKWCKKVFILPETLENTNNKN